MSSNQKYVYVVEGSTGEYSDRREWMVRAYLNEKLAQEHAANALKWIKDYGEDRWRKSRYSNRDSSPENPYDPRMDVDYTGVFYSVLKVELDES